MHRIFYVLVQAFYVQTNFLKTLFFLIILLLPLLYGHVKRMKFHNIEIDVIKYFFHQKLSSANSVQIMESFIMSIQTGTRPENSRTLLQFPQSFNQLAVHRILFTSNAIKTPSNSANSGDRPVPRSQVKLSPGLNSRGQARNKLSLYTKKKARKDDGSQTA